MAYGYNNSQQTNSYPQGLQPSQVNIPNQNVQPLFPQPQGNVYNINSTLEVANVPVGAGVSVALCMPENVMFIKTMQNGNPLFYPYKIMPFNTEAESQQVQQNQQSTHTNSVNEEIMEQLKSCLERITNVEEYLKKQKKGVEFAV